MPERKFRIVHLEASKGLGGQEIRVVKECREFMNRGHDVEIICQPDAGMISLIKEHEIPYKTLVMRGAIDLPAILFLRKYFKEAKTDIVHTHSSIDSWVAGFAGKLAGVPLIVRTRHVSIPVKNAFVYRYMTDLLTTTGIALRKMFIEELKIPEEKVYSVPTGIDLELFNPERYDRNNVRKELDIPEDVPVIAIIGVLRWWKGHKFFIEAAKKILDKRRMVFLIVGTGPGGSIDLVDYTGYEENIKPIGYRKDVPNVLAATDILVSASVGGEGVSQSIIQALAMKKGVIATNAGSSSEIVREGETGILIPPSDPDAIANAIEKLVDTEGLMEEFGSQGRKLVEEKYSIQKMTDDMESLYNKFFPS